MRSLIRVVFRRPGRSAFPKLVAVLGTAAALAGWAADARGQTAAWNVTSGNWSATGSWTPATVPNAVGAVANFTRTTTSTATVDTAQTVGSINFNSTSNVSWTITPTAALTLNQDGAGSGSATISNSNTSTGTTNALIIAAGTGGLVLADNLLISNTGGSSNTTGAIQIISVISGTGNITFSNVSTAISQTGSIRLQTAANTFTGNLTIQAGTVTFNNANSFGSATTNTIFLGASTFGSAALLSTTNSGIANNIVVASGTTGTLTLGTTSTTAFNAYTGSITLNGNVSLTSAGTANAMSVTGVVSGAGGITKVGAGITTLTNSNTYQGALTVTAGTLNLTGSNTTPGAVTVTAGTLGLSGAGTLAAVSGVTASAGGTVAISDTAVNPNRLADAAPIALNAATFSYTGNAAAASTETVGTLSVGAGASSLTVTGTTAPTLTIGAAANPSLVRSGTGTLAITGTGTAATPGTVPGIVNGVTGWVTVGTALATAASGGSFAALTAYQDATDSTTWATTDNVRVGGTTAATPVTTTAATPTTVNSVSIQQAGNSLDLTALGGPLTVSSGGVIAAANGSLVGGSIRTGLDASAGGDLIITTAGAATVLTMSTAVADAAAGAGGLTKAGAGTLALTGTSTLTGTTTVNAGTLSIGNGGTAGALGTGPVVNLAAITYTRTDASAVAGPISGTGTLTVSSGTLTLSAAASYTGNTTVATGAALVLGMPGTTSFASGLQAGGGSVTYSGGGTLRLTNTNGNFNNTFFVTNNSTLALGDGTTGSGSVNSSTATINIAAGSTLLLNRGTTDVANFLPTVTGGGGVTKVGSGDFTLGTTAATYTGPTVVQAGRLIAGGTNAFGTNSAVSLTASGVGLSLATNNVAIGSLSGVAGSFVLNSLSSSATTTGTLTIGGDNTSTLFAGRLFGNQGTITLVKTGVGSLTLSNQNNGSTSANTYTGGTTINGGALYVATAATLSGVNGSGTGAGTVTVNSGGTLGGTAVVYPSTASAVVQVNAGGTIRGGFPSTAPGGSASTPTGTLTIGGTGGTGPGGLNLAGAAGTGGASLAVDLNGNPVSSGTVVASLIKMASGTFTVNSVAGPIVIDLLNDTGLTVGTQFSVTVANGALFSLTNGGGTAATTSYVFGNDFVIRSANFTTFDPATTTLALTGSNLILTTTPTAAAAAVPEPATVFGLAAGALGLGGLVRRRRRA